MVKGGTGGANTKTGKIFEIKTDLKTALIENGYDINDFIFIEQCNFNTYLKKNFNFDMTKKYGTFFKPDEAIIYNNVLYIVEKKQQGGGGSVDEKVRTGPFLLHVYEYCAKLMGLKGVSYTYLLGDYFKHKKFSQYVIPTYLKEHGIPVYFNTLPLEDFLSYYKEI
jgi:hypothetical protein